MLEDVTPVGPDGLLAGKVAIITGASQGIGQVAAFGFARAGAKVVLAARSAERIEAHARRIKEGGGDALAVVTDVKDEASVRAMVERALEAFGRLDCAFNNAGAEQHPGPLVDTPTDVFDEVMDVKVRGIFLGMKYQVPAMLRSGGGAIVNHGSVVGIRAIGQYPAPGASQAAVIGLTRSAAAAYALSGIRINVLATGNVLTAERAAIPITPERRAAMESRNPMKRPGRPEEIAAAAAWLCSDWASFVTGAVIPVDGGHLAGTA